METDTYNKLLSSASLCFSKKGFRATSIGDISRQANMSQGAMYRHFHSKEDLIIAIVKDEVKAALAFYSAPYTCSSFERIYQIMQSCIVKKDSPINPSLWIEVMAESARNTEINQYFLSADTAMRGALKVIIEKGIVTGEFELIDSNEISIVLFAILDGLIARRANDPAFEIEQALPLFRETLASILNLKSIK